MYAKKFTPYGQFPSKGSQLYEDEYEEEESEPLVEQVDSSYEPTDREVKQYAVQTLGMSFPEDEGLLYLAREGLKAPLPPNWVPYQSPHGQVYYKHRITQEKTMDHPTDIEYRKKYEQQKQKMARKNLKSMNMKATNPFALPNSNPYNPNASNMMASKLSNSGLMAGSNHLLSGSNNLLVGSSQPPAAVKLNPRVEEEYEQEFKRFEERLRKELREFQNQEQEKHEARIKKMKQEYQTDIDRLFKNKGGESKMEDKMKIQKEKIKQKLQQITNQSLQDELKDYQKSQEQQISQFVQVYQSDNRIKSTKFQQQKIQQFESRELRYQQNVQKANKLKQRKKKQRQQMLNQLKLQLQDGSNPQIEAATQQALQTELAAIKETYSAKLKQSQADLLRQYNETKKVLGFDQTAYLSELASKKSRIKTVSLQKLQSYKKKQIQALNSQFQADLDISLARLKQKLQNEYSLKLTQERRRQQQRITKQKQAIDEQIKRKSQNQIQTLYDQLKLQAKSYQTSMNKKLSTLNQRFINDIYDKSRGTNQDITAKLQLKQKQMALQNKIQMIASLKRQKDLQLITYQLLKLQKQLHLCTDPTALDIKLTQLAKNHQLEYRTEQYLKYEKVYQQIKNKYKRDKEFLASVMNSLQGTQKISGVGGVSVLRQYNQDVRLMRVNEQMLNKFQVLLKKAETNDKNALMELAKGEMQYKEIEMRREMIKVNHAPTALHELSEQNVPPTNRSHNTGQHNLESALRDHSKFLTTMRHELNRKLYQLRSGSHY